MKISIFNPRREMSITRQISNHTDKINIRIQLLTAAEYRNYPMQNQAKVLAILEDRCNVQQYVDSIVYYYDNKSGKLYFTNAIKIWKAYGVCGRLIVCIALLTVAIIISIMWSGSLVRAIIGDNGILNGV